MTKNVFRSKFSYDIFDQKYRHTGCETWEKLSQTLIQDVCNEGPTEGKISEDECQELTNLHAEMKVIAGGRYLYYAGRPKKYFSNCYILKSEEDSRENWASLSWKAENALMTGGGIGNDYSIYRPSGAAIGGSGGEASGPLPKMEMINEMGRRVMQGGSRRCIPEGSLVHTTRGMVKIEEIQVGDIALTSDGSRYVRNVFHQGEQQTIKLILQTGEFECTPNHKMAVLTDPYGGYEFKEARYIEDGDRLLFIGQTTPGIKTYLPSSSYEKPKMAYTNIPVEIPHLDTEMSWFLGYFHANGYSSVRHSTPTKRNGLVAICIPDTAPDVISKCRDNLERFGTNVSVKEGDGACKIVRTSNVELALWFQENIKQSHETLEVPRFILEGTEDLRAAYMAGVMDGDGSILTRPVQIMACIHKEFLKQLQGVCASLGFATRLKMSRPASGKWRALYELNLVGSKQEKQFHSTVGEYLIYKTESPRVRKKEQCAYSLKSSMIRAMAHTTDKKGFAQASSTNLSIESWEKMVGENLGFTPVKVLDTVLGDRVPTWDIEVEDRHEFYCNGILTHNSALYASLSCDHGDVNEFLVSKNWDEMMVAGTDKSIAQLKEADFNYAAPLDMTNISVNYNTKWLENYWNTGDVGDVFRTNCRQALKTAEPGFSFNFFEHENETGRNACTEFTSEDDSDVCNLGSINMGRIDTLSEFKTAVELMTKFLICGTLRADVPYEKVGKVRESNRKVGLGLMGMHEWLIKRSSKYEVTEELHRWLKVYKSVSKDTAKKFCDKVGISQSKRQQAIAPTGTIGILAG